MIRAANTCGSDWMRGYAICGERRSGSNYLCDLLRSTGVLGVPREYFVPDVVRRAGAPDYPSDPVAQVKLIPSLAATPNGIYGLKLHAQEFDQVEATRWAERMPSLSFVYLERRDVLGQAISFVRAFQTKQWVASMPAAAMPQYDGDAIQHALIETLSRQNRWRYYFARNGIAYLHLVYEDVVRSPQEAVDAIARLVGLDGPARIDATVLRFKVQRDETSQAWRERFVAEMHDLGRFD